MGIDIRLEDRKGKLLEEVPDVDNLLSRLLPSWEDPSFQCLRNIDPWGDTVFNHLQMDQVISELQRVRLQASTEEERAFTDSIESMARRCQEENLYLKFLGD